MTGWISKVGAAVVGAILGAALIPGCVIRIGPGTDDGATTGSTASSGGMGGQGGQAKTPEELGEEAYALLDPQDRALAAYRASVTTYALAGALDSLSLDPASLDNEAVELLMQQYGPSVAEQTNAWLATIDPSTIPLVENRPRYECTEQWGCPYATTCKYNYMPSSSNYRCFVNECGDAKCTKCPSWVADGLKHLIVKAWCSYVCVELNVHKPKAIAVGAGGISALFGDFVGPICFEP